MLAPFLVMNVHVGIAQDLDAAIKGNACHSDAYHQVCLLYTSDAADE